MTEPCELESRPRSFCCVTNTCCLQWWRPKRFHSRGKCECTRTHYQARERRKARMRQRGNSEAMRNGAGGEPAQLPRGPHARHGEQAETRPMLARKNGAGATHWARLSWSTSGGWRHRGFSCVDESAFCASASARGKRNVENSLAPESLCAFLRNKKRATKVARRPS